MPTGNRQAKIKAKLKTINNEQSVFFNKPKFWIYFKILLKNALIVNKQGSIKMDIQLKDCSRIKSLMVKQLFNTKMEIISKEYLTMEFGNRENIGLPMEINTRESFYVNA